MVENRRSAIFLIDLWSFLFMKTRLRERTWFITISKKIKYIWCSSPIDQRNKERLLLLKLVWQNVFYLFWPKSYKKCQENFHVPKLLNYELLLHKMSNRNKKSNSVILLQARCNIFKTQKNLSRLKIQILSCQTFTEENICFVSVLSWHVSCWNREKQVGMNDLTVLVNKRPRKGRTDLSETRKESIWP